MTRARYRANRSAARCAHQAERLQVDLTVASHPSSEAAGGPNSRRSGYPGPVGELLRGAASEDHFFSIDRASHIYSFSVDYCYSCGHRAEGRCLDCGRHICWIDGARNSPVRCEADQARHESRISEAEKAERDQLFGQWKEHWLKILVTEQPVGSYVHFGEYTRRRMWRPPPSCSEHEECVAEWREPRSMDGKRLVGYSQPAWSVGSNLVITYNGGGYETESTNGWSMLRNGTIVGIRRSLHISSMTADNVPTDDQRGVGISQFKGQSRCLRRSLGLPVY
jgi:hypothetical protein